MKLEEKIFQRKRFVAEKLLSAGFRVENGNYRWETDFMSGDFHAVLSVDESGRIKGSVIDAMNREEYTPLRNENMNGAYVRSVRAEYEKLLLRIAETCCTDVWFQYEQANRIAASVSEKYHVLPDFPWEKGQYRNYGTFRHADSRKWFAVILNLTWDTLLKNRDERAIDVINLKVLPEDAEKLTKVEGFYPAYHMNHRHWISIVLNDTLSDGEILKRIDDSFLLTGGK